MSKESDLLGTLDDRQIQRDSGEKEGIRYEEYTGSLFRARRKGNPRSNSSLPRHKRNVLIWDTIEMSGTSEKKRAAWWGQAARGRFV
jgi:hypothetical protein